jgi:hypothetical protein
LAVVSSAAINIGVQVSQLNAYIPPECVAGEYDSSIFSFLKNFHTDFHSVVQFAFSPTVYKGPFPTSLPAVICSLADCHSDWGEMDSQ